MWCLIACRHCSTGVLHFQLAFYKLTQRNNVLCSSSGRSGCTGEETLFSTVLLVFMCDIKIFAGTRFTWFNVSVSRVCVLNQNLVYRKPANVLQGANEICQKFYFRLCFSRSIYNAAVWYYNHCLGQMPVVMVTEDEDAIRQYGNETEGVFVISFKVTCQKNRGSFSLCCIKMMKQVC